MSQYYGDSYAFCYWKVEKSSASSASMYEKSCENNVTLIFIICSHKMPNRIYDLEKESKLEEDWAKSLWPSQKTWTLWFFLKSLLFLAYNLLYVCICASLNFWKVESLTTNSKICARFTTTMGPLKRQESKISNFRKVE